MHSNHKCNYCELSLSPLLKWLIESCLCLASCDKNRLIRYILQWVRNVLPFSMCLLLMGDNKSKSSITCDTIRIFLIFGKGKLVRLGSFCCIKNNEDAISALLQCQMTGLLIIAVFIMLQCSLFFNVDNLSVLIIDYVIKC